MNQQRLRTVRDEVAGLSPAPAFSNSAKVTHETLLTAHPEGVAPIDTLDMNTWHSKLATLGGCRTLGCIAGVTVCLYREEAREIGRRTDEKTGLRPSVSEIAQQILDLNDAESWTLFHSEPRRAGGAAVTPEQAATAIDRLLAGDEPEDIWDHTGPS